MSRSPPSRKRQSPFAGPLTPRMVPDLLGRYGELLERYPAEIIDVTWLPATKLIMIQAFKLAWLATQDADLRNHIEIGWVSLSSFQDEVGSRPVGCEMTEANREEAASSLDRYVELAKRSDAEGKVLVASLTAFKAANT